MTSDIQQAIPAEKQRDPYFDNVRTMLIVLVVVGHLVQAVGAPAGKPLEFWIYSFHMPAFILISGYLARRFTASPTQTARLATGILLPYIIFQLIHSAFRPLFLDKPFSFNLVFPAWTLWFLMGLFIWRLLTPLFRTIKYPLLVAVLVSVLSPLDAHLDQAWSMARVLGFLPFYVLGLVLEPRHFEFIRTRIPRWIGYAVLTGGLAASYLLLPSRSASVFFLKDSYADHGSDLMRGMLIRVVVLVIGLIGTLAILSCAGSRKTWLTRVGRFSLYVYLLHALVLFPVRYMDLLEDWTSPSQTIVLVLAGTVLAVLLASAPVIYVTRWLIDAPWSTKLIRLPKPTPPVTAP